MVNNKKANVSTPVKNGVNASEVIAYLKSIGFEVKKSPVVAVPKQEVISITIRGVTVQVPVIEQETAKGNPSLRASTWTNVTVNGVVYNIPPMSIPMTAPKEQDTPKPSTKTPKSWLKAGENHLAL